MPSFCALIGAFALLLAFPRRSRIARSHVAVSLFTCLALSAGPSRAQSVAELDVGPLATPPLAVTGMGLMPSGNFSLTISNNEVGATTRLAGITVLTVTPTDGFSEPVGFQCSGLPAGATCSFSPTTVTPVGNPVTDTVAVSYSKPNTSRNSSPLPIVPAGVAACALLCGIGLRKRPLLFVVMVAVAMLGLCTGCGTSNSELKTYQVTLTASSGSLQHDITFLLTVE